MIATRRCSRFAAPIRCSSQRDLADEAFAADLVYVSGLSNRSADCFPVIIDKAKGAGALVAVNAGVRQLSARGGAFLDSLGRIDILAINRPEADALVPGLVAKFGEGGSALTLDPGEQPPPLLARGLVGGGYEMSLPAFLCALRRLGTRYVMLTDGRGGAFVCADGKVVYCPAVEATVAGTAGAGDAMAATFAAFVALGRPSRGRPQGRDAQCRERRRPHRHPVRPAAARCPGRATCRPLRSSIALMEAVKALS